MSIKSSFQEADDDDDDYEDPVVLRRHRRQSSMNTSWQQEDTVNQQRRCSDLTWAADEELLTIRSGGSRRPYSWGPVEISYRRSVSISIRSPRSHEECKENQFSNDSISMNRCKYFTLRKIYFQVYDHCTYVIITLSSEINSFSLRFLSIIVKIHPERKV